MEMSYPLFTTGKIMMKKDEVTGLGNWVSQ